MASTYLSRVHATTTNVKQWTVSVWLKRAKIGYQCSIWGTGNSSGYYGTFLMFSSDDTLRWGNIGGSGMEGELITNRVFRDTNAWYHIVVGVDTDQSTASNRVKIYVNGVQETSFSTNNQPSQGQSLRWNQATSTSGPSIGRTGAWDTRYFEGCMSHINLIDGTQYAASDFGSTDSTTGEWQINTSPSVTYGTNGAFILKDGNSGTDQSPNTNNWTVGGGTLTKTESSPSNVFATLNPLSTFPVTGTSGYFSNGNTVYDAPEGSPYDIACGSTLGVKGGKWYWEVKWNIDGGGTTQALGLGIYEAEQPIALFGTMRSASGYKNVIWDTRHDLYVNGSDTGTNYTASSGDILGFALDLDAGTLKIHQNGTYYNSGNAVTSAIDVSKTYLILASPNGGSANHSTARYNFGNGYFGTTAVSSAGTNASGIGIFEYDVPTGYTALSTKGLNL